MAERRVGQHRLQDLHVVWRAFRRLRRYLNGMHDAAEARVRPDDRCARMPLEQRLHLRQIHRFSVRLGERHVDVAVQNHDEARISREVEDAIERRIRQACGLAGNLRGDELLVGS
jgi:hypothetical protein